MVEGTVLTVRYDLERDGLPYTQYTIDVLSALRGSPGNEISVLYVGGSFDGTHWLEMVGAPRFGLGERVVIHAESDGRGGYRMVDWDLGILRQRTDESGRDVSVDGKGRPLESLPCDILPPPSAGDPRPRVDDSDPSPPVQEGDPLADALSWADALAAVASCAGLNPYGGA